ncbi:hypothetical protein SAMN02745163_00482 [Clostridium cavendishii DSM 21758]|uniref:Membrane protein NfeD2 N-terminal transmembrane domain-containing protein n=1 Tax=Clostridium cavendishii DSM 21758 TaxID=1121302 RepID=A0A1M6CJI4_9CLOT|nr:DUF1449 family protein [Clostridium cavendishii]SHI61167.1 hypothetical protein SAMN02745163_00482 [Clostridium cavendishii DSM 21758]
MGFYEIVFWVGVIYTVITFLLGGVSGILHFDAHVDSHMDTHIDTHVDSFHGTSTFAVFPIKPITVVSFLTVFGGTGIVLTKNGFLAIVVFIIATFLGLLVSTLLYKLVVVPLYKAQNTSAVYQKELIGIKATVITPILKNSFGTIAYVVNGSKNNSPAKSVKNTAINQGEEVLIFKIEDNVFYVEPLNENK